MNRELADFIRDKICNSAFELIVARGHSDCTIKDFARQAGVSVGTVYNYFESKEYFLSCLRKKASLYLLCRLKRCVDENLASRAKLDKVIKTILSLHREYAFFYDFYGFEEQCSTVKQEVINNFTQTADVLEAVLREGIVQDQFKRMDSQSAARLLVLACIGAAKLISLAPEQASRRALAPDPFEGIYSLINKDPWAVESLKFI